MAYDDTEAIRKAFSSGAPNLCFPPGRYLVDGTISIPASIQRINFLYADMVSGPSLRSGELEALFSIDEDSQQDLIFEDLYTWVGLQGPFKLLRHAAKRDLYMSDIHTQEVAMYHNTISGSKVFIENCACTQRGQEHLPGFPLKVKTFGADNSIQNGLTPKFKSKVDSSMFLASKLKIQVWASP